MLKTTKSHDDALVGLNALVPGNDAHDRARLILDQLFNRSRGSILNNIRHTSHNVFHPRHDMDGRVWVSRTLAAKGQNANAVAAFALGVFGLSCAEDAIYAGLNNSQVCFARTERINPFGNPRHAFGIRIDDIVGRAPLGHVLDISLHGLSVVRPQATATAIGRTPCGCLALFKQQSRGSLALGGNRHSGSVTSYAGSYNHNIKFFVPSRFIGASNPKRPCGYGRRCCAGRLDEVPTACIDCHDGSPVL